MFTTRRNQLIALSITAAAVLGAGVAAAATGSGQTAPSNTTAAPAEFSNDVSNDEPHDGSTGADPSAESAGAEPADEVAEDNGGDAPGVIEGDDLPTDPPPPPSPGAPSGPSDLVWVPKPAPPLPPVPGPLDLTTVPPASPIDDLVAPVDPTPIDGPGDFQVVPLPGYLDTISSGLTGCELDCVTTAILTANDFGPDVHLAVETTVPVHIEIEVAPTGGGSSTWFDNPGYDPSWAGVLGPLQPDTTYDLTLTVIDQDGHDRSYEHQFTTVDIVDGFASNAQGCALPCITEGVVHHTDRYDVVELHVETDTPASLTVWVSTDEPTWDGDVPSLPSSAKVWNADVHGSDWTLEFDGLQADTTYHVIARAHDQYGTDHQVGTFTTAPVQMAGVLVTFEKIDVLYDGDTGTLNRGELSFRWGFDGGKIGMRSEEKMHFGVVELDSHNTQWFSIDAVHGVLPEIRVAGAERDGLKKYNVCEASPVQIEAEPYWECTNTATNVARTYNPITLADIEAMPLCGNFGIDTADPQARCMAIGTPDMGDDFARFAVIVSFSI